MCDLYLGPLNSRSGSPPNPFWTNPSITCPTAPGYVFTADGTSYPINVMLQNHDLMYGAMGATVELFWADPTTGFALTNSIGTVTQGIANATPVTDANNTYTFNWAPNAAVSSDNGGHVCLAAVASVNEPPNCVEPPPQMPPAQAVVTSPQVAIHNVQVNAPGGPMPPPPPGPGGMRHRFPWPFFFGATNAGSLNGRTRLVARAYSPQVEADRDRLWELAFHPGVRSVAGRCLKFGTPASVHLATGIESILIPALGSKGTASRLSHTGPVHPDLADHLVKRDWVKSTSNHTAVKEVELFSRQSQQAAVWVEPHGEDGHLYAVEISHELLRDAGPPIVLGGLTVVFVPLCRPW
jgi:hypothetical protein